MCYWVLMDDGQVLARTTVQQVTSDDIQNPTTQERMHSYTLKITERLNDRNHIIPTPAEGLVLDDEATDENDEPEGEAQPELDDYTDKAYNAYIGAELLVLHGDSYITGHVIKRPRDDNGNPVGRRHTNPLLDTREYQVQFGDGSIAEYTANLIAENIYAQCNPEGHYQVVFKEITDHRKLPTAVPKEAGYTIGYNRNRHMKKTTKGWDICVEWCDGTTSWLPLKDVKQANPLELAKYASTNKILDEPAFAWWAPKI